MNIDGLRFGVLSTLASGPQHGYGILRELVDGGEVDTAPPVGSLYRVLDRLAEDGLIREAGGEVVDGRFRRYFELTDAGAAALADAAAARLRSARLAQSRLRRHVTPPVQKGALA